MSDICFQPAWRQMEALNQGRITSVELLEAHLARFNNANKTLNAVIKTDLARARERANGLDRMRADGRILGPLHGLPMTVKDTLDVDNMPATAGAPQYQRRSKQVPDAATVSRARAAGAVIWGKTNVPYLAGEWQTHNTIFGRTNNPYDLKHTPGGSSGGAAAALAAGITPLEIGSDIGGSLRIPAHFTGVASLKPSYGMISQAGHIPPDPEYPGQVDLNVVGPMARCVRDLKLLRSVIQPGATGSQSAYNLSVEGLKIASWMDDPHWPVDAELQKLMADVVKEVGDAGAEVSNVKPDINPEELIDVYLSLLIPIVAMDIPELQRSGQTILRPLVTWLQRFEKTPYTEGNWIAKSGQSHLDWMKRDGRRAAMKGIMREFFQTYDALIMPVSATPALLHNTKGGVLKRRMTVNGKSIPYASHLNWIALATALHLPAAVVPIGKTDAGLPYGLQIVGALGEDARVLDIAEAIEGLFGGYRRPQSELGLF